MKLHDSVKKYVDDFLVFLQKEENFYKNMSLYDAIENAARGMAADGKMSRHQRRIGRAKCEESANELSKYELDISGCKTFEDIFKITEAVKNRVSAIGDLWSYDTALRIGFNMGYEPEEIYLQCGAGEGAILLLKLDLQHSRSISIGKFPDEIKSALRPYQIENYLCVGNHEGWFV